MMIILQVVTEWDRLSPLIGSAASCELHLHRVGPRSFGARNEDHSGDLGHQWPGHHDPPCRQHGDWQPHSQGVGRGARGKGEKPEIAEICQRKEVLFQTTVLVFFGVYI